MARPTPYPAVSETAPDPVPTPGDPVEPIPAPQPAVVPEPDGPDEPGPEDTSGRPPATEVAEQRAANTNERVITTDAQEEE